MATDTLEKVEAEVAEVSESVGVVETEMSDEQVAAIEVELGDIRSIDPTHSGVVATEEPATDPLFPELSPAQIAEHEHHTRIVELNDEVCTAKTKWSAAKDAASARKKEYDALVGELIAFIKDGPELQRKLPLKDGAGAEAGQDGGAAPANMVSDEWRKLPTSVLSIKNKLVEKLHDASISTLGDLSDFWKAGKKIQYDVKGIGEAGDAEIVDAFSTYGAEHPEVFGEKSLAEKSAENMAAMDEANSAVVAILESHGQPTAETTSTETAVDTHSQDEEPEDEDEDEEGDDEGDECWPEDEDTWDEDEDEFADDSDDSDLDDLDEADDSDDDI